MDENLNRYGRNARRRMRFRQAKNVVRAVLSRIDESRTDYEARQQEQRGVKVLRAHMDAGGEDLRHAFIEEVVDPESVPRKTRKEQQKHDRQQFHDATAIMDLQRRAVGV